MNDVPFNSEREQAERLDEWITAAQAGGSSENETVAELRRLVKIGRAIHADDASVHQLEEQLSRRHSWKRRAAPWRRLGLVAAVMVVILFAAGVFHALYPGEAPQPTGLGSGTTPVALAATSTLAVQINASLLPATGTTTATAPPSAAVATATPTPLPSATPALLLATMTPLPLPSPVLPSATLLATSTPAPAVATIVPAVNPTTLPIFPPAQLDVLFIVDSNAGISALESDLVDLFSQVTSLPNQPDIRFGLVTIGRDGVRTVDFTRDSRVLLAALQTADAAPGAWTAVLSEAAAGVSWRENATIKLIIGIGLAGVQPGEDYTLPLRPITAQGIVLDMIALGDVDDRDALIFRDMTQISGGHFVELADSNYTLNEWIVQWIAEKLAALQSG